MDKNTLEKLKAERPLDWQESVALDQALERQADLRHLVGGLEDPSPSMAMRSELNQRLVGIAAKKRRARLAPWFGGLVAATACVAFFVLATSKSTTPSPEPPQSIEAALTSAHTQAVSMTEDDLADLLVDEVEL